MTTKKSVVTELRENHRQWQSTNMMYIHYLVFANGDSGEYFSTEQKCSEFVLNEMAEYSIETRGFRGTKPDIRIKPVGASLNRSPQRANDTSALVRRPSLNNNGSSKPQRNENAIMAQHAITKAVELFASGGIKMDEVKAVADEILQYTVKRGMMTNDEILALPVKKKFIEKGEKGKKEKEVAEKLF